MDNGELFDYTMELDEQRIRCPICLGEYSHVRGAYTRYGSDPWEAVLYQGTVAKEMSKERRSALVIVVDGECGHSWKIVLQQHKGLTFLEFEQCRHKRPRY
jgi:hypothetical protein